MNLGMRGLYLLFLLVIHIDAFHPRSASKSQWYATTRRSGSPASSGQSIAHGQGGTSEEFETVYELIEGIMLLGSTGKHRARLNNNGAPMRSQISFNVSSHSPITTGIKKLVPLTNSEEISLLCRGLGALGLQWRELAETGTWQVIEGHIASRAKLDASADPDTLLDLLHGLEGLKISWRTLDVKARLAIESHLSNVWSSRPCLSSANISPRSVSAKDKAILFRILRHLGNLRVRYRDLSSQNQEWLRRTVLVSLQAPAPAAMALIVFALGNMEVDLHRDFDAVQSRRMKLLLTRSLPSSPRHTYWMALSGISLLGLEWASLDSMLRRALELPLELYGELPTSSYSPREMCLVLKSLAKMRLQWAMLRAPTQRGLLTAVGRTMNQMNPKEISLMFASMGAIGVQLGHLDSAARQFISSSAARAISLMPSWEASEALIGLTKMCITFEEAIRMELFPIVVSKHRYMGPNQVAMLVYALGIICSNRHSDESHACSNGLGLVNDKAIEVGSSATTAIAWRAVHAMIPTISKWAPLMSRDDICATIAGLASIYTALSDSYSHNLLRGGAGVPFVQSPPSSQPLVSSGLCKAFQSFGTSRGVTALSLFRRRTVEHHTSASTTATVRLTGPSRQPSRVAVDQPAVAPASLSSSFSSLLELLIRSTQVGATKFFDADAFLRPSTKSPHDPLVHTADQFAALTSYLRACGLTGEALSRHDGVYEVWLQK